MTTAVPYVELHAHSAHRREAGSALRLGAAAYECCRAAVRAAPVVRAMSRLERHEGTTNVVVTEVTELDRPAPKER